MSETRRAEKIDYLGMTAVDPWPRKLSVSLLKQAADLGMIG